ncbi:hypothetical protein GOP47_0013178 [Adiantum capillus-veneris]|uniref:RNA uridylyltransferase n=1 Tax=Adiantum capillus-veneris TaxID=13818 RepID=A0A9D4ZEA6_ADICA|nr:hypothetical protein GOP47_0013178 [Adiantum capillus-veneris]
MESSSSQNPPISRSPPVCGAASPSSGGEFLLQLLQQGRPSSTFPRPCSSNQNSFGDGNAIHSRHHSSSSSSGADWGGSSSFSRASSMEACAFEEEQARAHLLSRTFSVEASVLDEEQAQFQLQHDPAVAAMGPSHPVGGVSAIANSFGNMSGEARGILPFHDRYAHHQPHHHHHHHHHHHQQQHHGLQQVPPPPPCPRPPPSEHLLSFPLDPLLPSVHNQFLRPYPRLSLMDQSMYLRVPAPTFSHTGLLNSSRVREMASGLSYPAGDQLKIFPTEELTNGQSMAPLRMLVSVPRSTPGFVSSSSSEEGLAPPKSQFYTQFGSIGVEIPHESGSRGKSSCAGLPDTVAFQKLSSMNRQAGVGPSPLTPKGVVAQSLTPVESSKGDGQHYPSTVEASTEAMALSGAHPSQKRLMEQVGAGGFDHAIKDGAEKTLESCAFPMDSIAITAPVIQKVSHGNTFISLSDSIANSTSVGIMPEKDCKTKTRYNKPQKGLDSMRKGSNRIGSGHWIPVMKEKREDSPINRRESTAAPENATNKTIEEVRRPKGSQEGWRSQQFSPSSDLLGNEPRTRPKGLDRLPKTKIPLQQDPLGLPSGSTVASAPSSATEQSKQALQVMPATDAVDARIAEGSVDPARAVLESNQERSGVNAGTLVSSLSLSELDNENESEEEITINSKHSASEGPNMGTKEFDARVTRPTRFNRREPFHHLDAGKCTINFLAIFQTLIPPVDEEQRRKQLLESLDELVSGIWPEARLYLFGSCANAFGVCNSDIDVCLSIEGESATRSEVVCTLADALKANHMQNVQALTHARVPIVKYSDPETGISCDVCVNNMLAVVNTKLLHDYAQIDVRLRQLAFMVKHWAKCRQVNETYRGTLSSYAYVLMCIHFLQQRKPPVLPCLQEMESTYRVTVGDIKCAYFDRVDKLKGFGQKNKETLADLVTSFFDYWAFRHDYTRTVISIRTGKFLTKLEKEWTRRIGNERHLICIEDPFEVSHDLGRVVDKHSIRVLRDEFQRAARIMRQDANPCIALFEPYIRQKAQAA